MDEAVTRSRIGGVGATGTSVPIFIDFLTALASLVEVAS